MKSLLLLLALLTAAAASTLACGGGSSFPPLTPAPGAPRNVIAFGARDGSGYGLYVIGPAGANLRRLYQEQATVSFPVWSPDGARVAYVTGGVEGPATLRVYDFVSASAATVGVAYVGQLGVPAAWSPDGKRLAFVEAYSTGTRLRVYDGKSATLLDTADVPASAVAWSRTSSRITVVRPGDTAETSDIITVKPDGTDLHILQSGVLEGDPRWSPDGKQLAFWTSPSAVLRQRVLQLSKSGSGTPQKLGAGLDPAWSPDAEHIVFARPAATTPGAELDIYTIPAAGGEPELVTHATTLDRWPSWSPAGDAVVFLAQADQNTAFVCVVALVTKKSTCLDTTGLLPAQPAWSPF